MQWVKKEIKEAIQVSLLPRSVADDLGQPAYVPLKTQRKRQRERKKKKKKSPGQMKGRGNIQNL
jgi:hypothetical protein